jgi:DNA-binding Xre family transcriptional regulator
VREVVKMVVSYNRLWKILIDRKMTKFDLRQATGLSASVITKMGKGFGVNTDSLLRICDALECDFADIMEVDKDGSSLRKQLPAKIQ